MHDLHPNGFGYDWGCHTGVCYLNSIYSEVNIFDPNVYGGRLRADENPGIFAMKEAVTAATGLEVQFYVLIDMGGFAGLIDALGGVEVTALDRLPIGGDAFGNDVAGYIEVGTQHMDGYTAEWFARSRYSTDDYDRMRRQRELQRAILQQMTPLNVLQRFEEIADAGTYLVLTDIPEGMLGAFLDLATKARDFEPFAVEIAPPSVNPEYPDYDLIHEMVADGVARTTPAPVEEDANGVD